MSKLAKLINKIFILIFYPYKIIGENPYYHLSDLFYLNTYKIGDYYVILPHGDKKILNFYRSKTKSKKVESNFSYTSDGNKEFMTISEIKKTVNEIVKKII